MDTTKRRSDCPLGQALDIFGDKWSLLIIRDLMFSKKCTYNEFLKSPEGIASNILASRLQGLEENKIIEKMGHPDSKAKILYNLTQRGIDLLPIIMEIYFWTDKYFTMPSDIKTIINGAKKDKEGFVKVTTKELKKKAAANSALAQ